MNDIGVKTCFDLAFEAAILANHYKKLSTEEHNNPDKFVNPT